jgi:hypothetical protein
VLEASAAGPDSVVAVAGSLAAAAVAQQSGVPVWAVVGRGRRLPARMLDAIVGPAGPVEVAVGLATADCPEAPELLRSVPRL